MEPEAGRKEYVRCKKRNQSSPQLTHWKTRSWRTFRMSRFVRPLLCLVVIPAATLAGQADTARHTKDSLSLARLQLPPVIVSASRQPTRQDRLGVSASILTGSDFKVEPIVSASDAVSRFPGV